VLLCALALIGLVGALHVSSSVSAGRERGSVAVARAAGRVCDACGQPPGDSGPKATQSRSGGGLRAPSSRTLPVDDSVEISRVSATSGFSLPPQTVGRRSTR
jgi:hypothetical protein